ncbi:hypothetical protein TrLO_g2751 [Triparma laevis f. longispina]|uniref:Uncharacterized protein n=1 Tax=Triparma laevis f. longispina TaxID=1714387 RepID=A0A9W7FU27_9STRA|nr:hypothetical protein TrLO_g2751 [Triparma laevis f. longispina]
MSQQSVAMRSSSRLKAQELGGESGGEDEESQNQGQGQGPVETPAARITKDDFMATDDFRRLLRGYVDVTELYRTFRMVSKSWQRVAEEEIDWGFRSGVLAFHGGYDLVGIDGTGELEEKREPVTRVIFLLNITKVGVCACFFAVNLVVADIPEGGS